MTQSERKWQLKATLAYSAIICKNVNMRTSLDFPDPMFRQLKSNAALNGQTLRDHVIELVERGMQAAARSAHAADLNTARPVPKLPSIDFGQSANKKLWPADHMVSNAQLHAALDAEDVACALQATQSGQRAR
jgi:hypothetical protein